jgi:hypothetical protein
MIFLAAGGCAVLLPYLLLPVIPGIDYPNHLARLAVLGASPGTPILANYAPHWALMPDLGLDLAYMALKPVASPQTVLRLCVVGALATMLVCAAAIQRSLFKTSSMALALMPLCCAGLPIVMGYVNFVMSAGLAMFGAWLSLAWRAHLTWPRVLALSAIGATAWLCHMAGYGMLMTFIFCTLLQSTVFSASAPGPLWKKSFACFVRMLVIALPGVALFALAERRTDAGAVQYGIFKLRPLLAAVVATDTPFDYILWLGVCAVMLAMLLFGRWRVAPASRLSLMVLLALIALLPWRIGSAVDVDSRLAAPFMLILLASSRIEAPSGIVPKYLLLSILAGLVVARDVKLVTAGMQEARSVAVFRSAERLLPAGTAMMVSTDQWHLADCSRGGPFSIISPHTHLAAYATIDRGIWEPFLFAGKGMQPIMSVRQGFPPSLKALAPPSLEALEQGLRSAKPAIGSAADDDSETMPQGWPDQYSYLLVLGHGCHANPFPDLLRTQAEGPDFTLFALVHPAKG